MVVGVPADGTGGGAIHALTMTKMPVELSSPPPG